jgi:hypothetical protein
MTAIGFIYQFIDHSFNQIGLRWPAVAYRKAFEKIFRNEEKIVCKWTVKLKDK